MSGHYRRDEDRPTLLYGGLGLLREPPKGVYYSLNPIKPGAYAKAPARMVHVERGESSEQTPKERAAERRLTVYVSPDVLKQLRHMAVDERKSVSALAERALEYAVKHPDVLRG